LIEDLCPNGVEYKTVGEMCEVITGGEAPVESIKSKIPCKDYIYPIYSNGIGENSIWGYSKKYRIDKKAVTFSSIGTIGLMKGVNTFNADKNIKLATYASRCIENEILMFLRKNNKTKGEISIDEPLNKDCDGNELLLSDILGTDPDITSRNIEDEVDKTLLRASILKLNEREKNIMEMRFGFKTGKEKTQKEVADELRNITKLYLKIRKENNK